MKVSFLKDVTPWDKKKYVYYMVDYIQVILVLILTGTNIYSLYNQFPQTDSSGSRVKRSRELAVEIIDVVVSIIWIVFHSFELAIFKSKNGFVWTMIFEYVSVVLIILLFILDFILAGFGVTIWSSFTIDNWVYYVFQIFCILRAVPIFRLFIRARESFTYYYLILTSSFVFAVIYVFACITNLVENFPGSENQPFYFHDIFYMLIITATTIGYGDFSPKNVLGKGVIITYTIIVFSLVVSKSQMVIESVVNFRKSAFLKKFFTSDHYAIFTNYGRSNFWGFRKFLEGLLEEKEFPKIIVIADSSDNVGEMKSYLEKFNGWKFFRTVRFIVRDNRDDFSFLDFIGVSNCKESFVLCDDKEDCILKEKMYNLVKNYDRKVVMSMVLKHRENEINRMENKGKVFFSREVMVNLMVEELYNPGFKALIDQLVFNDYNRAFKNGTRRPIIHAKIVSKVLQILKYHDLKIFVENKFGVNVLGVEKNGVVSLNEDVDSNIQIGGDLLIFTSRTKEKADMIENYKTDSDMLSLGDSQVIMALERKRKDAGASVEEFYIIECCDKKTIEILLYKLQQKKSRGYKIVFIKNEEIVKFDVSGVGEIKDLKDVNVTEKCKGILQFSEEGSSFEKVFKTYHKYPGVHFVSNLEDDRNYKYLLKKESFKNMEKLKCNSSIFCENEFSRYLTKEETFWKLVSKISGKDIQKQEGGKRKNIIGNSCFDNSVFCYQ